MMIGNDITARLIPETTQELVKSYERLFRNRTALETIMKKKTDSELILESRLKDDESIHIGYILNHKFEEGNLYETRAKIIAGVNTIALHEGYSEFIHNHLTGNADVNYSTSTQSNPNIKRFIEQTYKVMNDNLNAQGIRKK